MEEKQKNNFIDIAAKYLFALIGLFLMVIFYLFGSSLNSSILNSKILTATNFSKTESQIHLEITADNGGMMDYDGLDKVLRGFYGQRFRLHPYSKLENGFSLNYQEYSHDITICSSPVYYDFEVTEFLALPLYNHNSSIKKGPLYGADFASYIPSTIADEMVNYLGLSNYDDLLAIHEPFIFRTAGFEYKMSINNIYLNNDSPHWGEISEGENTLYYKDFATYNKNSIFSHCPKIFRDLKRTKVCFDMIPTYSHINTVAKKTCQTSNDTLTLSFNKKGGANYKITANFNDFTNEYFSTKCIVYYSCAFLLLAIEVILVVFFEEIRSHLLKPFFVILAGFVIFSLTGEILKGALPLNIPIFTIFNYVGNVIAALFVLIVLNVAILLQKEAKDEIVK